MERSLMLIAIGPSNRGHARWLVGTIARLNTGVCDALHGARRGPPGDVRFCPLSTFASVHHFGSDERNNGHASDVTNRSKMTQSGAWLPDFGATQHGWRAANRRRGSKQFVTIIREPGRTILNPELWKN
jgi:hypothetical protein